MSSTPPLISQTPKEVQTAYTGLDPFERRFVRHYIQSLNGSRAMRQAGYKGLHPNTQAYKLLQRPDVRAAVDEYERFHLAEIGARAVVAMRETLAISTSDPRKLVWQDWEELPVWTEVDVPRDEAGAPRETIGAPRVKVGDRKMLHELDNATASAIAAIDVEEISTNGEKGTRYKYKFWDKNKALDKLGQYTKLWDAKGNVTNVDARTINATATSVHVGGPAAVSTAVQLLERLSAIGAGDAAAPGDPNGSVLPAAVCPQPAGRGTPVDAGADPRGPGKT